MFVLKWLDVEYDRVVDNKACEETYPTYTSTVTTFWHTPDARGGGAYESVFSLDRADASRGYNIRIAAKSAAGAKRWTKRKYYDNSFQSLRFIPFDCRTPGADF